MVPGTSNGFLWAWWPEQPGEGHQPGTPTWTGRYRDGLGSRITILGAANPEPASNMNEGPSLLRNDTPRPGGFLALRLGCTQSNGSAIGASVTVTTGRASWSKR